MEDEIPLHAVINRVLDRRRQWLEQQGISLDSWVIERGLQSVLTHLSNRQKSKISMDELKSTWGIYDREASEEITVIIRQQPKSINSKDEVGCTPLHLAVVSGCTAIAGVLLDHGANMMTENESDSSMLHVAVRSKNTEMVQVLLERGADVTSKDRYGSTVLHIAVRSRDVEMVELLLKKKADMTAKEEDGGTALHVAVSSDNPKMVELLLKRGADKEAVDEGNRTPLHIAVCYKNTHVVKALLNKGASVKAVNSAGTTPLHFAACYSNTKMIALLLNQGAQIDASDNVGNNPLSHMIATQQYDLDDESIAIAHFLCSQGSEPKLPESSRSTLKNHQLGLLAITEHWHQCYRDGKPLMNVQSEVIKGGETAVNAYLDEWKETAAGQLLKRCKVYIVGPTTWGKTSLAKSLSEAAPSLVDEEDHTIGIDLFPLTFPPSEMPSNEVDGTNGDLANNERYEVTFWDFAGQDIYQCAHVIFFSKRAIYVMCIDLPVYTAKLKEMVQSSELEGEKMMERFFEESVLRWIRLILLRQPDAYFKLIGTKSDEVPESSQISDVGIDLNIRLIAFIEDPDRRVSIPDENGLKKNFDEDFLPTSSKNKESLDKARVAIRETIRAKPELTFDMLTMSTQILEHIVALRRTAKRSGTHEDRLKAVIISVTTLCTCLMRKFPSLKGTTCRGILRTLHKLGEVMWYEEEDKAFRDVIILDPTIMLDLVRDVINHEYEAKDGKYYKRLRENGTLPHSLLMKSPYWSALQAIGSDRVHQFKLLLMRFNLAYPVNRQTRLDNTDMIVPTYWKMREKAQAHHQPLSRQHTALARNFVVGACAAKWKYSLPIGISEAIFVSFVVQSYRSDADRKVEENYVECFVRGEFGVLIYFITNGKSKYDDITIEVAAGTNELAWAEMRYFVIAMELVLLDYPGLISTQGGDVERFIVEDRENCTEDHSVNYLIGNVQPEEQLRGTNSWFPPDFKWFIQSAWTNSGKLDELQLSHELVVLKRLIVSSEKRRFPAVWTISYPANSSTIELRMHSDLSGKCYHEPLKISSQSGFTDFVRENSSFIQIGISVLSIATGFIPYAVAGSAVELALSFAKEWVDHTSTVKSILDKAHLNPSEDKASTEMVMSPEARMNFLKKLLTLYDPSFDESSVSDTANLCCATTKDGSYVWVHSSELQKLVGHLTPCADITLDVSGVDGLSQLRKKIYCEWDVVYNSDTKPIAYGQTEKTLLRSGAGPLWTSPVKLNNVDTVEMLHECTLNIRVYQSRHLTACFRKAKEIGHGSKELKSCVQIDISKPTTIEILIPLSETTSTFVNCQIKIEFPRVGGA